MILHRGGKVGRILHRILHQGGEVGRILHRILSERKVGRILQYNLTEMNFL